jgi:hypothetical protein
MRGASARDDDVCEGLLKHGVYAYALGKGIDECNLWGDYLYGSVIPSLPTTMVRILVMTMIQSYLDIVQKNLTTLLNSKAIKSLPPPWNWQKSLTREV